MTEQLQDRRQELLRKRLAERGLAAENSSTATRRAVRPQGPLPTSAGQRRMWVAQQQDPRSSVLNICLSYQLSGELDVARLRAAVESVVARHEILRTVYFVDAEGELRQEARSGITASFAEHDLAGLSASAQAGRLEVLVRRDFTQPFDLSSESPLRISVLRLSPQEHVFVLTAHHICWDDGSWPVFFAEVNRHYNSKSADGGELAALTEQFADVADLGSAEPSAEDLEYWRGVLAKAPEPVELPGEQLGSAPPSALAGRREARVSAELAERVRSFAAEEGATPYMVLLAAFAAVLRGHTDASEFLITTPVAGTRDDRAQALIGYFGNIVLLRSTVAATDSFQSLVAATKEVCAGAFSHQDADFSHVVASVRADVSEGLARLSFSARSSGEGLALSGASARRLDLRSPATQLPLAFAVEWDEDGATVEAEYLADVLDGAIAEQLLRRYVTFLEGALGDPERPVFQIDLLGSAERAAELAVSSGAAAPDGSDLLHALVERQAGLRPDEIAVWADGAVSYRDLNERANRLARWLTGRGVGAEDVVAVQIAASVEFLVATLGALKAGAAYLPVDPTYPAERIEHMLADSRPVLRFDVAALAEAEEAAAGFAATDLDDGDRVRPLRPENLAYIIYTSGSTGKPKGVAVAHREIAAHTRAQIHNFEVGPKDRMLQLASVSFDASLSEIFIVLGAGGRMVIPAPGRALDIVYLGELMVEQEVSIVHMVPSLLAVVLSLPEAARWRTLRRMPVGGEALPGEVADKAAAVWGVQLGNFYGPTEAVVCATGHPVAHPAGVGTVPIGGPLANVRAYVLDDSLELAPPGVVGELYLGGAHLARGYLARPALTAERFIADPFVPGERMYRTGDLVRRGAAGELEFIGRADEQVKIRGFRIELGEVSAAVSAHPSIGQCVVDVRDLPGAGRSLIAYAVPAQGSATVIPEQVRAQVATVLPGHMVPAAIVVVDHIPLTASGKLDKRALPEPDLIVAREYRAPSTPTEIRLAELFAAVLGVERISVDDSFFELGGHSLLVTRLVARIRAEFGVDINVRAPFEAPTPAALAVVVENCGTNSGGFSPLVETAFAEGGRPPRIPLSSMQRVFWFQQRLLGPNPMINLSFALRVEGPLDLNALAEAFTDVAGRHEPLRTVFPDEDGAGRQLVLPLEPVSVPVVDLADGGDEALQRALAEEAQHCYAIGSERPLRPKVFVLGPDQHVVSVLLHHFVVDHWSANVLFADLAAAYGARALGEAPSWEPLPVQFADYALWQQENFFGESLSSAAQTQLEYWTESLAGLPAAVTVPTDRPRPVVLGKRGATVEFAFPHEVREGVLALAKAEGVTEFMAIFAALAALANQFGAGDDIPIGTPSAGRSEHGAADLVGVFVNLVTLRADLSDGPTPRELLARAKQTALGAYSNQDLPFEQVVDTVLPARSLAQHPFFQILLHVRETPPKLVLEDSSRGRTVASALPLPFEFALTDLSVALFSTPEQGYEGVLIYNVELYDESTAQALAEAMPRMLRQFVEAPDAPARLDGLPERALVAQTSARQPFEAVEFDPDEAPATETERVLAALLEQLLGAPDIRRGDGFFALGGDSVLSIQWAARAQEAGLPLSAQMVFEHPALAELAHAVDRVSEQSPADATESEAAPDLGYEPMAASGLSDDMLAAVTSAWQESR